MNSSSEKTEPFGSGEFQENLDLLRQTYFFSALPLDSLKVLAYICTREIYKPGEAIFRQGEEDSYAYFIISGTANLIRRQGEEERRISQYGPGDFLGGLALLSQTHRLFSLIAETRVSCLLLARDKFKSTSTQFPEIMPKIMKAVAENIHAWEERFLGDHNPNCTACQHRIGVTVI